VIRTYEETDSDQVAGLWRQVFAYPTAHNDPVTAIARKLALQRELFFVAVSGSEVLGTAMAGYDGHRGWLYSVAVRPENRGKGIGKSLVLHAEAALRALDCPKINLQILQGNTEVVGFYEALGYTVEPRINMGKVL
jgi:ribosomal protein S18 acetylase RimI-like enzyme